MLHIRWKCRFQLKNAAKSMENGQNMLQTVANTVENTMENERFELKTVAHTVEMAVSSSKMLQIAWKMVRTGNPKKFPKLKKKNPQTISYPGLNPKFCSICCLNPYFRWWNPLPPSPAGRPGGHRRADCSRSAYGHPFAGLSGDRRSSDAAGFDGWIWPGKCGVTLWLWLT